MEQLTLGQGGDLECTDNFQNLSSIKFCHFIEIWQNCQVVKSEKKNRHPVEPPAKNPDHRATDCDEQMIISADPPVGSREKADKCLRPGTARFSPGGERYLKYVVLHEMSPAGRRVSFKCTRTEGWLFIGSRVIRLQTWMIRNVILWLANLDDISGEFPLSS